MSALVEETGVVDRRSRFELAELAAALRARGYLQREIADELGVSRSYAQQLLDDPDGSKLKARKDSYRRPCPDCGRLMDGSNGHGPRASRRCAECERTDPSSLSWTRELIVASIREWCERFGEPPTAEDWGVGRPDGRCARPDLRAVFRAEVPYWPQVSTVQTRFGSWANAIEAAGFPRPYAGTRRHVGNRTTPPAPATDKEPLMDAHDAAKTSDCSFPGCTNEAAWTRGKYAFLCAEHARTKAASSPPAASNGGHRNGGLAAAVVEFGRLGKQVDAKRDKAKKLTEQALTAKAEADAAEREFRSRARELMGDVAA